MPFKERMVPNVFDRESLCGVEYEETLDEVAGNGGKSAGEIILESYDFLKREIFVAGFERGPAC